MSHPCFIGKRFEGVQSLRTGRKVHRRRRTRASGTERAPERRRNRPSRGPSLRGQAGLAATGSGGFRLSRRGRRGRTCRSRRRGRGGMPGCGRRSRRRRGRLRSRRLRARRRAVGDVSHEGQLGVVADLDPDLPARRGGVVLDGRPVALAGGLCLDPVGQRRRRPVGADRDNPRWEEDTSKHQSHLRIE